MTGEELRDRIAEAVVQPYPESVFGTVSDEKLGQVADAIEGICTMDALSATTIRACVGPWAGKRIAAAIVEALGKEGVDQFLSVVDEMHDVDDHALVSFEGVHASSLEVKVFRAVADALTTLLDAAEDDDG